MFFLQKHRFSNLFYLFFQICIASHIQIQAEKKKNHLAPLVQSKFKRGLHILFMIHLNGFNIQVILPIYTKIGETPYGGSSIIVYPI